MIFARKQITSRRILIALGALCTVGITSAFAQANASNPPSPTVSHIWLTLLLGSVMGAFGQGCRVVVGLITLTVYNIDKEPDERDLFNLARLIFSFLIGALAGFITGLVAWQGQHIESINLSSFEEMFKFAVAGYIGTDIIEAFTTRFFSQSSSSQSTQSQSNLQNASQVSSQSASSLLSGNLLAGNNVLTAKSQTLVSEANEPATRSLLASRDWTKSEILLDLAEAMKYGQFIKAAAAKYNLDPSLICAIGSRESNWGRSLRPKGPSGTGDWARRSGKLPPDDKGWGRGLMQADYAASSFAKDFAKWSDPEQNIDFGCDELRRDFEHFEAKFPNLSQDEKLRAGIAAYNTGPGNVEKSIEQGHDVDFTTAGHDYSKDVLTRAAFFKGSGLEDKVAAL